ncbi:hypothetical protein L3N51_02406 [Metallosphaera sp. J1]|uniref:hypothetical protein n=1 Tax=Metallosphaera javensis (ex Hofmann et al. 2022) TaxID=99938 RepID=UPI001EDE549D|nr:hypothetical protein [Metallosphaera javensis (ex Hofmann et al. 2022)]MCG3110109.1 hypothetical protein [Metallosphaera javensis (ex Hofmann et al. 2022)]
MTWKFKSDKVEVKDVPICVVDEIEESPKLRELFARAGIRTGHGSPAHRLVSEVVIKVFQERKETLQDVISKWNVKGIDEILKEIEEEARERGIIK